jgi:hypothetical protein
MAERDHHSAFEAEYEYHRREWIAQRIGWVVLVLLLVAAVSGLFSSGPLSHTTAQAGSNQIEYERFARYSARTKLVVATSSTAVLVGNLPVQISRSFIDAHRIESITPEPKTVSAMGDAIEFVFDGSTRRIVFRLEPDSIGRHEGELRIGSDAVRLSQFIYP